jgi:hypothetical protein
MEASMRSILIACPMILFAFAVAAQTVPSVPKLPSEDKPATTMPGTAPSSGTSLPGAGQGQTSNPIDQAKTEAECKIPTNAAKPECLELMLKK